MMKFQSLAAQEEKDEKSSHAKTMLTLRDGRPSAVS